ncbi:hypothetical protein AGABI2DRAFT_145599 [Agaricus bisporus var. bisporus H97]|uniref:hypothetical protein n=1 Tax=Agaricus bisporus var. bisporus (strain H97 / ATCC MYA-4626 / FGSC 10389) TaxID=936046 RepID=UPI00029F5721|nr:hypothetical protein AGABI2DRAFT_145599 [Agaricus bisporus var. bisporus H97]EKV44192.1 hypothetical protein AGABI2DRAFT_145599 [Agaricus bisporus var. bisporus H97]
MGRSSRLVVPLFGVDQCLQIYPRAQPTPQRAEVSPFLLDINQCQVAVMSAFVTTTQTTEGDYFGASDGSSEEVAVAGLAYGSYHSTANDNQGLVTRCSLEAVISIVTRLYLALV